MNVALIPVLRKLRSILNSIPVVKRFAGMQHGQRMASTQTSRHGQRDSKWILLLIVVVCTAPVVASYFIYYAGKPIGNATNYGTLIEPQRPIPSDLAVRTENGRMVSLQAFKGHWLMLTVDRSTCGEECVKKLYFMRQVRVAQGIERDRVVTLWLRIDTAPVSDTIRRAYPNTRFLVANPAALSLWLPTHVDTKITDHIYLIDPNGNLMMRFPEDANPSKINHDLNRLLKVSR